VSQRSLEAWLHLHLPELFDGEVEALITKLALREVDMLTTAADYFCTKGLTATSTKTGSLRVLGHTFRAFHNQCPPTRPKVYS
jgi:hypothetical protein